MIHVTHQPSYRPETLFPDADRPDNPIRRNGSKLHQGEDEPLEVYKDVRALVIPHHRQSTTRLPDLSTIPTLVDF